MVHELQITRQNVIEEVTIVSHCMSKAQNPTMNFDSQIWMEDNTDYENATSSDNINLSISNHYHS